MTASLRLLLQVLQINTHHLADWDTGDTTGAGRAWGDRQPRAAPTLPMLGKGACRANCSPRPPSLCFQEGLSWVGKQFGSRLWKDFYHTVVIYRSPKQKREPREQQERGQGRAIAESGVPTAQHHGLTAGLAAHTHGKVPFQPPWDVAMQLLLALFTPCSPSTVRWA